MKNSIRTISFLFFFVSTYSFSNEIKEIELAGIKNISRGTILSYIPYETGDLFEESSSNTIINELYKTGFFQDIQVGFNSDNGILTVKLTENPTISYFEVKGYKNDKVLNEKNLELSIQDMKLSSGNVFQKRALNNFISSLDYTYSKSGFFNYRIEETTTIDDMNRVGITINIDEGENTKIRKFSILGSKDHEEDELLNLFDIGEPDFFLINYWTEKDNYSDIEYSAGKENLKSFFYNKGYLEFEIVKEELIYSDDKRFIDILLSINHGPKYTIRSLDFSGDFLNIPKSSLRNLFGLKEGDLFQRKEVIDGLNSINDFFGNQGFAFIKVDASSKEDISSKDVGLDINIQVNERVYVNRISISGNNRTQDDVIRREINLLEGQQYSLSELNKSIDSIKRLGYFDSVELKTERLKNFPDKINIFIEVVETKTGEFSIGLSQSNATGAAFNFGISEKNFLGTGNTLDAKLISSEAVEEISFYYLNPDFNGKKHTISYGANSKTVNSQYIDLNSYSLDELGVNASYGIPISEYGKFINGFKISSTDLTCGSVYSAFEPAQCNEKNKSNLEFSLISSIKENSLNDSTFPSDGRSNNINLTFAMPIGDLKYYKFDLGHSSYYPLNNSLTAKFAANFGLIDSYDNKDTPFYKRYFGGGASSIRGFVQNSIGPKYPDGSNKGGELSYFVTSSIISPLTFIDDNSNNMRIGAFVEGGSIHESYSDIDFNDFRAATGLAFSWKTPIGPIGVHYAKPLIKKDGDKLESFSFTLGSSF